jgi:hypothetical protein
MRSARSDRSLNGTIQVLRKSKRREVSLCSKRDIRRRGANDEHGCVSNGWLELELVDLRVVERKLVVLKAVELQAVLELVVLRR